MLQEFFKRYVRLKGLSERTVGHYVTGINSINVILEKYNFPIRNIFEAKTYKYTSFLDKLEALNPIKTLKRGYTITKVENKIISDIKEVKKDMILKTKLENGEIISKVMEVKNGN